MAGCAVAAASPVAAAGHTSTAGEPAVGIATLPEFVAPPLDGIDLDPAHRTRIDDLHARIETLTHYELLGIDRSTEKKGVKRAYFELASLYHPDRYFRKNLGSYKPRMEALFARITQAQDVLTSKVDRAEYDAYLDDVARSREMEARLDAAASVLHDVQQNALLTPTSPPSAPPSTTTPSAPSSTPARPASSSAAPNSAPAPASASPFSVREVPPSAPPVSAPPASPKAPSTPSIIDAQGRRDALARRLLGSRPSMPPASMSAPPPSMPPPTVSPPGDALRRHYEARLAGGRAAQARRLVDQARASLAKDDVIAAVSSFKLAREITPDDPDVLRELAAATHTADTILAETYKRQAFYEEKNGQWPEASKSWTRVANIKVDDAFVQERAAHALVQANANLHDAAKFAQRAVVLEPLNGPFRGTLGAVYLAAGLHKNARRELEAAQQLAPQDATILALSKRAGKA